jgi:hypothetical protein
MVLAFLSRWQVDQIGHAASGVLSTVEERTNGLPLPVETESVVDARSRAVGGAQQTSKKPPRRTRGLGTRDKQVLVVNKAICATA